MRLDSDFYQKKYEEMRLNNEEEIRKKINELYNKLSPSGVKEVLNSGVIVQIGDSARFMSSPMDQANLELSQRGMNTEDPNKEELIIKRALKIYIDRMEDEENQVKIRNDLSRAHEVVMQTINIRSKYLNAIAANGSSS